jgi:hypothetical protein
VRKNGVVVFFSFLAGIILVGSIFVGAVKAKAASLYTPFGGRVEKYIPQSQAACVTNTCGKLSEPVRAAVKSAIAGPVNALCASVSLACSFIPLVGNAACLAACIYEINKAVDDSINLCSVEEIRVGPPKPASVGILRLGELKINVGVRPSVPGVGIGLGPRINIVSFKLNLVRLLPGASDFIPDAKVYLYGDYKTEGNWVLGDSLNLLNCPLGEGDSKAPAICKNPITSVVLKVLGGGQKEVGEAAYKKAIESGASLGDAAKARQSAEADFAATCPLLNLVHQIGTSKNP